MIPIVLTGTIVPNSIKVKHLDWKVRRQEYLEAIRYYKTFSKVYFCENSDYDLLHDPEFCCDKKFQPIKFKKSSCFEKGKGFQEFQMLDEFVNKKLTEDCLVKVTGRYIYKNFDEIYSFILRQNRKYDLIIDTLARSNIALTCLFYVKKETYLHHFQKHYLEMDDFQNIWAEHVIYKALKNVGSYTFFPIVPILNAISGSTGGKLITNEHILKMGMKNAQRKIFRILKINQLLR